MTAEKQKSSVLKRDVQLAIPYLGEEEAAAAYRVAQSGWISMGERVKEFESAFAARVGARHAIAANNGTAALHLALIAAGIREGDEVLVPDITFISTANVVLYEKAIPVLVECDPKTFNINLEDAKKRITPRTRAIIPVDMNGMPVDYDEVIAFARQHELKLIADSAESLGATYKGRKIGSIAPTHVFSFFPNKNVTTGEGGMITTDDDRAAKLMREVRNQGQDYRYHHIHLGYNYRMTDIPAAIGIEQLKKLDTILTEKQKIVDRYDEAFKDDRDITIPYRPSYVGQHSWYMYTVTLRDGINRDKVKDELFKAGIDTRLSFPPIHIQPYYQERYGFTDQSYPVSFKAWKQLLNIPIWVGLSLDDQNYVIETLRKLVRDQAH